MFALPCLFTYHGYTRRIRFYLDSIMKSTPALVGILVSIVLAIVAGAFLFRSMHALDPLVSSGDGASEATGSGAHPELYGRTFTPTYSEDRLTELDQELLTLLAKEKHSVSMSREMLVDNAIEKARLYDAIGQTGKAIETLEKIFEDNFDRSGPLNNAMATYYEKVGASQLALDRYDFLVRDLGDFTFLQRVARIWQDRGNQELADKAMRAYERMRTEYEAREAGSGVVPVSGVSSGSGSDAE